MALRATPQLKHKKAAVLSIRHILLECTMTACCTLQGLPAVLSTLCIVKT